MAKDRSVISASVSARDCLVLAVPAGRPIVLSPGTDVVTAQFVGIQTDHRICILGSETNQVERWIARIQKANPAAQIFGVSRALLACGVASQHEVIAFVDFKDEEMVLYDREAAGIAVFNAGWLLRDQRLAAMTAFKQSGFNLQELKVTGSEIDCWIELAVDDGLLGESPPPIRQNSPHVLLDARAIEFLRESLEESRRRVSGKVAEWLIQSTQPGSEIAVSEAVVRRMGVPRDSRLKDANLRIQAVRDGDLAAQVGALQDDVSSQSWFVPPPLIQADQSEFPLTHERKDRRSQVMTIGALLVGVSSLLLSAFGLTRSPGDGAASDQLEGIEAAQARIQALGSDVAELRSQVQAASESDGLKFLESKLLEQRNQLDLIDTDLATIRDTELPGLKRSFQMITQGVQFIPTDEGGRIALLGKDKQTQVELSTDVAGGKLELLDSENRPMLRVESFSRAGRLRLWKAGVNSPLVVIGGGGSDAEPAGEIRLYDGSKYVRVGVGGDIAEAMDSPAGELIPGTVVRVHPEGRGVVATEAEMDPSAIGVVSGAGGLSPALVIGGDRDAEIQVPVATAGTVYVRATAISGPIEPGDLLVSSETPGMARASGPDELRPGALLGKALSRLDEGEGLVLMWVGQR